MNIFKKIKKLNNEFAEPQPITNGNKYQVYKDLETQKKIDIDSLTRSALGKSNVEDIKQLTDAIRDIGNRLINEKNIDPYFLLQLQANYFCGTCKFETKDTYLKRLVLQVIRGAFMQGTAGIYVNKELNILEPVYLTRMEYGIDGKLKKASKLPLNVVLMKMSETKSFTPDEHFKGFVELNEEQCKNLAVFHWGIMGYSAWINIWPFINLQHLMLTICIINAFVFNKKWIYKLSNFSSVKNEIELFFDPTNPFIVNMGNSDDIANRFITEDVGRGSGTNDPIDYYNKLMGIYYHLLGRKVNNDVKKERNVGVEVEATQENYDVVQSDWLNQFELFLEDLRALTGIEMHMVKDSENLPNNEAENDGGNENDTNGNIQQ